MKPTIKEECVINSPSHYTQGDIECIDALKSCLTEEQYIGFLKGTIFAYTWRMGFKDDMLQEAGKIEWYIKRLKRELSDQDDKQLELF